MIRALRCALRCSEEFQAHAAEAEAYCADDRLLHRFLTARKHDSAKAGEMLRRHLVWRFRVYRPFDIRCDEMRPCAITGAIQVSVCACRARTHLPVLSFFYGAWAGVTARARPLGQACHHPRRCVSTVLRYEIQIYSMSTHHTSKSATARNAAIHDTNNGQGASETGRPSLRVCLTVFCTVCVCVCVCVCLCVCVCRPPPSSLFQTPRTASRKRTRRKSSARR
jgi:hypothetical protein